MIDSHAHYDDERFDGDRETLLESLFSSGGITHIINAATDIPSCKGLEALSGRYAGLYHTVGIHPHDAESAPDGYADILRELSGHPKAVAIGEIGLDFHYDFSDRDIQRAVFARQLDLAAELGLPAVIHDREAHKECMDAVLGRPALRSVFHSFSGSAESAHILASHGVFMSFNGMVTFKNAEKTRRAVQAVPDELLLVETDCPYLTPHPFRGRRNDSSMLVYTVRCIAQLRGKSEEYIESLCTENALRLFDKIKGPVTAGR